MLRFQETLKVPTQHNRWGEKGLRRPALQTTFRLTRHCWTFKIHFPYINQYFSKNVPLEILSVLACPGHKWCTLSMLRTAWTWSCSGDNAKDMGYKLVCNEPTFGLQSRTGLARAATSCPMPKRLIKSQPLQVRSEKQDKLANFHRLHRWQVLNTGGCWKPRPFKSKNFADQPR